MEGKFYYMCWCERDYKNHYFGDAIDEHPLVWAKRINERAKERGWKEGGYRPVTIISWQEIPEDVYSAFEEGE